MYSGKFILAFALSLLFSNQAWCGGQKDFMSKIYQSADGKYYKGMISKSRGSGNGPDGFYFYEVDKDGKRLSTLVNNDFNFIGKDKDGNITSQYEYYPSRITYVLDENDRVVAKLNRWQGDVVENYKYTESGKLLVYKSDGTFVGAYEDIVDYHTVSQAGKDSYNPNNKGKSNLVGDLSLVSEDGNFYDKDENGNILGIYNKNGDITKYEYDAGGNVISASKNGESIYERTHYTPPEAAAAMPDKDAKYSIKIDF